MFIVNAYAAHAENATYAARVVCRSKVEMASQHYSFHLPVWATSLGRVDFGRSHSLFYFVLGKLIWATSLWLSHYVAQTLLTSPPFISASSIPICIEHQ